MLNPTVDYHIHSQFSDGHHAPEEIVISAISMGMTEIGFSDHSYTPFEQSYCMQPNDYVQYRRTIHHLKEKYEDKISIKLGIEQDFYSDTPTVELDYVIGAVHFVYLESCHQYLCIDSKPQKIIDAANQYFSGDIFKIIELYYENVGNIADQTKCDIVAHFDIITKYNELFPFFDENHDRYINAWKKAADRLLQKNVLFEINTGAISRGMKTKPYPCSEIASYLLKNGASFILGSDSHDAATIAYHFKKYCNGVD